MALKKKKILRDLQKIHELFNKIEDIYNEIPETFRYTLDEVHTSNTNIPHCFRWGIQNSQELIDDLDTLFEEYEKDY